MKTSPGPGSVRNCVHIDFSNYHKYCMPHLRDSFTLRVNWKHYAFLKCSYQYGFIPTIFGKNKTVNRSHTQYSFCTNMSSIKFNDY